MATVLRGVGRALCVCGRGWLLGLMFAAVLCAGTARAQALPNSGVQWSVGPGSSAATATLNGSSLAVAQSLAVTAALYGVTKVWPVGRVVTTGAAVMGSAGRVILQTAMSRGVLTGSALTAAMLLTGDTTSDPGSNAFRTVDKTQKQQGTQTGFWTKYGTSSPTFANADAACAYWGPIFQASYPQPWIADTYAPGDTILSCRPASWNPGSGQFAIQGPVTVCPAGTTVIGGGWCTVPGAYVPATNANIEAGIAAKPASFVSLWQAGGCDSKSNTYVDISGATAWNDPCATIVVGAPGLTAPTVAPATVPTSNNPYAWPNQVWTEASGNLTKTHTVAATSTVAANSGVDSKVNPVTVQTTKTETVATNDGTNTTTTTTTTTGNAQSKSDTPQQTTTATFSGGTATLYTKKSKTFSDVLVGFQNTVRGSAWYTASTGFFSVTISSGSCPHWAMPANHWMPALDAGQFVCSSTMLALYAAGGVVVMIVAAWAAFRIAFL